MTTTKDADNVPAEFVAAFVDSVTRNLLEPAVERYGSVEAAAAALVALMGGQA